MWHYFIIPSIALLIYGVTRYAIRRGDKQRYEHGKSDAHKKNAEDAAKKKDEQLKIASYPNADRDDILGMFGEGKL